MGARSKYFDPHSVKSSAQTGRGDIWHKLLPWAYAGIGLVVIILAVTVFWPVVKKSEELHAEILRIEKQIIAEQAIELKVKDELYALQDDENPFYIERLARDKLQYARKGETIFKFEPYEDE